MALPGLVYSEPWCGAVTDRSAIIKASVAKEVDEARLLVSVDSGVAHHIAFTSRKLWTDPEQKYKRKIAEFLVSGLDSNQRYFYQLLLNDKQHESIGTFRTFPPAGTKNNLRIAFASCSGNRNILNYRYPQPEVYAAIRSEPDLHLFLHLGDLHYGNIKAPEMASRLEKYEWMLRREQVAELFKTLPIAYTWDDHDFLGNDRDGGNPKYKAAARHAREAYDAFVPHYPFADTGSNGIYQSFVYGNIFFILTDTRFNKWGKVADQTLRSMLGKHQKQWLKQQLLEASGYDLCVWGNSLPWIGKAHPRELYWAGYADERKEISDFIVANRISNLCMLSGDAHMLAIDDGSNTGFGPEGSGGFPLFHAAAMESRPSRKGGVYSKGRRDGTPGKGIAGSGQYGLMEIKYELDEGGNAIGSPHVYWTGKRVTRSLLSGKTKVEILLTHDFAADRASYPG